MNTTRVPARSLVRPRRGARTGRAPSALASAEMPDGADAAVQAYVICAAP